MRTVKDSWINARVSMVDNWNKDYNKTQTIYADKIVKVKELCSQTNELTSQLEIAEN